MSGPRRRVDDERSFVLHRRAFRETSLLVELLTEHHGRIGVVARGVRRGRGAKASLLQPFQPLLTSWTSAGELGTLRGVEPAGPPWVPAPRRLVQGLYVNELLLGFLARDDPHEGLLERYTALLIELCRAEAAGPALRLFERDLLAMMGYAPELEHEFDSGAAVDPEARYRYDAERGLRRVADRRASVDCFSGSSLLALARGRIDSADALAESERLLASLIDYHRGGRPLRSLELLRADHRRYQRETS